MQGLAQEGARPPTSLKRRQLRRPSDEPRSISPKSRSDSSGARPEHRLMRSSALAALRCCAPRMI